MTRNFFSIFAGLLCIAAGYASAASEGASGAQFLRIGVGAKETALGETGAVTSGAQSLFYNPAGASEVKDLELTFSQVQWISEINYSNLAAAKRIGTGVLGLAVNYLSMPPISEYNNRGVKLAGKYSAMDAAASLGYSRMFGNRTGVGIQVKYISSSLASETAWAAAADAGVKYELVPEEFTVGFTAQNLGTSLKYVDKGYPLPYNFKLGGKYVFDMSNDLGQPNKVSLLADINQGKDAGFYANAGLDFLLSYSETSLFALRGGYRTNTPEAGSGYSLGFGLDMRTYALDYAYAPNKDFGATHRLTFTLRFTGESND